MKKIQNWKINISIILIIFGLGGAFIELFYTILQYSDIAIILGIFLGFFLSVYFTVYIPIKVLYNYKKGNDEKE